jgi:hypothetical protein
MVSFAFCSLSSALCLSFYLFLRLSRFKNAQSQTQQMKFCIDTRDLGGGSQPKQLMIELHQGREMVGGDRYKSGCVP